MAKPIDNPHWPHFALYISFGHECNRGHGQCDIGNLLAKKLNKINKYHPKKTNFIFSNCRHTNKASGNDRTKMLEFKFGQIPQGHRIQSNFCQIDSFDSHFFWLFRRLSLFFLLQCQFLECQFNFIFFLFHKLFCRQLFSLKSLISVFINKIQPLLPYNRNKGAIHCHFEFLIQKFCPAQNLPNGVDEFGDSAKDVDNFVAPKHRQFGRPEEL